MKSILEKNMNDLEMRYEAEMRNREQKNGEQKSTNEMRREQMEKVNERISQLQNNTKVVMAVSLIIVFSLLGKHMSLC